MTKIYTLVERSGSKVIAVGERYVLQNLAVGERLIVEIVGSGGNHYVTTPIKRITHDKDEIIVTTQNTVYAFKEAE